jgi:hypothetical protein
MDRARLWVVTSQIPPENQHANLDYFENESARIQESLRRLLRNNSLRWAVGQLERGERGRAHLQCALAFRNGVRMSTVKELIDWPSQPHCEKARGSAEQNAVYCSKEQGRICVGFEVGDRPAQGQRSDLVEIYERLRRNGDNVVEVADDYPGQFLRYGRAFRDAASFFKPRPMERYGILLWGDTGTGKSRNAANIAGPQAYYKDDSQWWEGYARERFVIWDDFDWEEQRLKRFLKIFDHHPTRVPVKGTSATISSEIFIVTSNETIDEWWPDAKERHRDALKRRFRYIVEIFDGGYRFDKGNEIAWLDAGLKKINEFE